MHRSILARSTLTWMLSMILIRDVVQQALTTGYLTVEAENQLRQLMTTQKYGLDDLNAFMSLQQAAMLGRVRQESRNLRGTESRFTMETNP